MLKDLIEKGETSTHLWQRKEGMRSYVGRGLVTCKMHGPAWDEWWKFAITEEGKRVLPRLLAAQEI